MRDRRLIDNLCPVCDDVTTHVVQPADPGSCRCTVCGAVAQLMVPIA